MADLVSQARLTTLPGAPAIPQHVDPAQYKDYILVMLFIKYMVTCGRTNMSSMTSVTQATRSASRARSVRERFVVPPEADFDYLYARRRGPTSGIDQHCP